MPAIVGLIGMLGSAAFIGWVGRALVVGMGFAVFEVVGLSGLLSQVRSLVEGALLDLPLDLGAYLGLANVDLYLNWVFLGLTARMSMAFLKRLAPGK